jgi:DNA polymerase III epsilon subunit
VAEFLADKSLFAAVADEFLAFVGDAQLVALNAGFDIGFLNAELKRACKPPIATERVIDTLVLARRKHAGNNTLDELYSRYEVDRSHRTQHGALLEAELLAAVYVEPTTTRQAALALDPIARTRPLILDLRPRNALLPAGQEFLMTPRRLLARPGQVEKLLTLDGVLGPFGE